MPNTLLFCTLAQLVLDRPGRYRLLDELGLDFCCGGRTALSQACARKGLDAMTVARSLIAVEDRPGDSAEALRRVTDHIDHVHHRYVRQVLPRLQSLLDAVPEEPRMLRLRKLFAQLSTELMDHMLDEERVVFAFARAADNALPDAGMTQHINTMIQEHDDSGHELERIRHLTEDYTPGLEASDASRALMDAFRELDADLHKHVYEENSLLFPLAMSIAAQRRK